MCRAVRVVVSATAARANVRRRRDRAAAAGEARNRYVFRRVGRGSVSLSRGHQRPDRAAVDARPGRRHGGRARENSRARRAARAHPGDRCGRSGGDRAAPPRRAWRPRVPEARRAGEPVQALPARPAGRRRAAARRRRADSQKRPASRTRSAASHLRPTVVTSPTASPRAAPRSARCMSSTRQPARK